MYWLTITNSLFPFSWQFLICACLLIFPFIVREAWVRIGGLQEFPTHHSIVRGVSHSSSQHQWIEYNFYLPFLSFFFPQTCHIHHFSTWAIIGCERFCAQPMAFQWWRRRRMYNMLVLSEFATCKRKKLTTRRWLFTCTWKTNTSTNIIFFSAPVVSSLLLVYSFINWFIFSLCIFHEHCVLFLFISFGIMWKMQQKLSLK